MTKMAILAAGLLAAAVPAGAVPNSFAIIPPAQGGFGGWPQSGAHPYTLLTGNCYNLTIEARTAGGALDATYNGPVLLEQYALNSAGSASAPVFGISAAGAIGTSGMLGRSSMTVTLTNGAYTFGAGNVLGTQLCFYAASRAPQDYESISAVGDFKLKVSTPTVPNPGVSPGYIVWHNSPQQMLITAPLETPVAASENGSTGTVTAQAIGSPFRLSARLTDSYWNRILKDNRTDDTVRFTASNAHVALNPVQATMTDGAVDTFATVGDQSVCDSTISITVEDISSNANNGFIRSSSVDVYIASCTGGGGVIQNEGYYQLTAPVAVTAGAGFSMTVTAKNVTIAPGAGDVQYKGTLRPLIAISPGVYEPADGVLGTGSFDFSADDAAADPSDHSQIINSQTYSRSGIIWLQLVAEKPDALAGASALAGPIQVFPGAASAVSATASPAIIGALSSSLLSMSVNDAFGNGIPNRELQVTLTQGAQASLSAGGIRSNFFRVFTDASGRAQLNVESGEISERVRVNVLNPGLTAVNVDLVVSLIGSDRVGVYPSPANIALQPVNIEYRLDENSEVKLTVRDMFGHEVWRRTYGAGSTGGQQGFNVVQWNGRNDKGETVAVGVYAAHLEISARGQTTKARTRFGVKK